MVASTGRNIVSSERTIIGFLVLIALGVRLIALERICLIARDGIHYVSLAGQFLSGSFVEPLSHPFHPLYSLLMAFAGGVIGDVELAGKLISLLLGSVTVAPVYLLGRTIYDSKVGAVAGLLFAFHPYCVRFSVDILSDSTFLCFFGFAFCLGLRAVKSDRGAFLWSLGAGGISGLAYLTRPEGILIPGFLLSWFILAWIGNPDTNRSRTIGMATALMLAFFCVAGPYLGFIKSYTGQWQISMKPSVSKVMTHVVPGTLPQGTTTSPAEMVGDPGWEDENPLVRAPAKPKERQPRMTLFRSIIFPGFKFVETCHYLLFLFLVSGVWSARNRTIPYPERILWAVMAGYFLCLCYVYYSVSYLSRRHFLPLIFLALPLVGAGFWEVEKQCSSWIGTWRYRWHRGLPTRVAIVMLLVTLAILAPKALKPQRIDKVPLKEAALCIREKRRMSHPVIMSNEPLVAYYAGGKHVGIPGIPYHGFVEFARQHKVDYVVFGEREVVRAPQFVTFFQSEHFRKLPCGDKQVSVFAVIP